jgi:hypothetical protein
LTTLIGRHPPAEALQRARLRRWSVLARADHIGRTGVSRTNRPTARRIDSF